MEVKDEWFDQMTGGENVLFATLVNYLKPIQRLLMGIFGALVWIAVVLTEMARHMGAWKFFWE